MRILAIHEVDGTISAVFAAPFNQDIQFAIRSEPESLVTAVDAPDLAYDPERPEEFERAVVELCKRYRVVHPDRQLAPIDRSANDGAT